MPSEHHPEPSPYAADLTIELNLLAPLKSPRRNRQARIAETLRTLHQAGQLPIPGERLSHLAADLSRLPARSDVLDIFEHIRPFSAAGKDQDMANLIQIKDAANALFPQICRRVSVPDIPSA